MVYFHLELRVNETDHLLTRWTMSSDDYACMRRVKMALSHSTTVCQALTTPACVGWRRDWATPLLYVKRWLRLRASCEDGIEPLHYCMSSGDYACVHRVKTGLSHSSTVCQAMTTPACVVWRRDWATPLLYVKRWLRLRALGEDGIEPLHYCMSSDDYACVRRVKTDLRCESMPASSW